MVAMGFRRLCFVAAVAAAASAIGSPGTAHAAAPPAPYTDEVLLVDGASTAAIGGSFVLYSRGQEKIGKPLLGLGVASYVFGVPVVHLVHGRGVPAVISLVLRLAVPMSVLGLVMSTKPSEGVAMTLVAAAFATPMLLDAAVLARPGPPPRLHNPDAPISDGTHVESRPRWDVIGLGGAGLVASYGLWFGAISAGGPRNEWPAAYYVPVVGPTLGVGKVLSARSDYPVLQGVAAVGATGLAVAQGVSLAAVVLGFASPRKVMVEDRRSALRVQPFLGPGSAGIAGTF